MGIKGEFSFLYPWVLILLGTIPLFALWFLVRQRKYIRDAVEFSQVSLLKDLSQLKHQVLLQRLLPVLLISAWGFGIVGLAQPVWKTKVATQNSYLMLVMDISISMEATDLSPNRLEAAKQAAIEFTRDLPDGVKLGLAFFAGNTYLVTPPIEDHKLVGQYLESLKKEDLRPGTAIGDALLTALDSLSGAISQTIPTNEKEQSKSSQPQGSIILLTDGESNLGLPAQAAVEEAYKQHVTVYTVGMGEESGAYVRGGIFTQLDESTLMTIAQVTGGEYYRAKSFHDFREIYHKISQKTLGYEETKISLTPWFLAATMLLILSAFGWGVQGRRF
jgi:Ca-activated chloride channel homolog